MPQPRRSRQSPGKKSQGKNVSQGNRSPGKKPDSQGEEPLSPGNPTAPANDAPASSPASSAAAASSLRLVTNAGPAFEGREVPEPDVDELVDAPPGIAGVPLLAEFWTPERAEYVVKGQGAITHALIGVGESDWVWQPAELDAVAPPLANSLNQVEPLRRLAPYADSIGALMGVAAYVGRSRRERAAVLAGGGPPVAVPRSGVDAAGEPVQPADAAAARRRDVLDRVLRGRQREPEPEQPAPAPETPGADVNWRVGE